MKNITLPTGTERLYLEEIAHYIANAMNPEGQNDPDGVLYELDKIQAWNEVEQAAKDGALRVRHPGTHGPFPSGLKMRDNAVVLLSDVVAYLADRGLTVATGEQMTLPAPVTPESSEQRQATRWQMCVDAGLTMPKDTYGHYPRGVGKIADELGISRQALQQDLNKYRERLFSK
jgi:hypothetical protein